MKLIVSPHADDETLGCGGLIAKDPDDCVVVVLSDKNDGRMDEFEAARSILGFTKWHGPMFKTGEVGQNARAVTTWLDQLIRNYKPEELYLPTPGAHQDHIAAYEAGLRAARLSYTNGAWYVPSVLLYDIPSYSHDLYSIPYRWSRFVSLPEKDMETKKQAIRAYASQSNGHFDPAVLAEEHANYLGSKVNTKFVEQFAVVRELIA